VADAVKGQYERLFAGTRCVLLNTAIGSPEAQAKRLLDLVP
jgi:hypothetical protein